jgi:hypothetical protein
MDRIVAHRFTLLIAGLAMMALPFALPRGWGFGLFSGFMLVSLGIYGVAFRRWRTEPGLWMLAVLLIVTLGPCWAYFAFLNWRAVFVKPAANAITWDQLRLSIDGTFALLLFAHAVKLAVTVAIHGLARETGRN